MVVLTRDDKHIILDTVTTRWICCDQEVLDVYMKCDGSRAISDLVREMGNEMTTRVIETLRNLDLVFADPAEEARKPPDWPDRLEVNIAVLRMTRRCNLNCRYCYANSSPYGQDMSLKVAEKIIDRLIELPQVRIGIQWGGGEPLLNYRVIEHATKYALKKAKENDKQVKFIMQTNGTMLNRHVKSLKKFAIGFGVSLDGPQSINDQTRVFSNGAGSYAEVEKSIRKLDSPPSCLVTVSQANAPYVEQIIDYFCKMGVKGLKLNPCRAQGRATTDKSMCLDSLAFTNCKIRALEQILRLRRNGQDLQIPANTQVIIRNFLNSFRKNANCYSSPSCGAGMRMLGFDVNGDIYPCDELTGVDGYLCGNVFEQSLNDIFVSSSVIKKCRERTVYTIPSCMQCTWRHFCGGGCAASAVWEYGDIMREDPLCEHRKRYFEHVLWKLALCPSELDVRDMEPIM